MSDERKSRPTHLPLRWLTEDEVLAYTNGSRPWLHALVESRQLRPVKTRTGGPGGKGPRGTVFDIHDVDAVMERLKGQGIPLPGDVMTDARGEIWAIKREKAAAVYGPAWMREQRQKKD